MWRGLTEVTDRGKASHWYPTKTIDGPQYGSEEVWHECPECDERNQRRFYKVSSKAEPALDRFHLPRLAPENYRLHLALTSIVVPYRCPVRNQDVACRPELPSEFYLSLNYVEYEQRITRLRSRFLIVPRRLGYSNVSSLL